jgi:hypothetical protein
MQHSPQAFLKFVQVNNIGKGSTLEVVKPWGQGGKKRHIMLDVEEVIKKRGSKGGTTIVATIQGTAQIERITCKDDTILDIIPHPAKH